MQGRPNNKIDKNEFSHQNPILKLHFQNFTVSFCFAWLLLWFSKLEENPSLFKIKHGKVIYQAHK